ncbi:sensor histidine kinase RegB [Rhodosalinus sp. 5P4]|uniref:sensor histidine kinase RegB n=1 Tax=Rhodosalinus sp. 5P4 TaxID=3239196 RepID=UPI0035257D8A
MTDTSLTMLPGRRRRDWIRLRTTILLRWMAIFGQLVALLIAREHVGLVLPLGPCLLVISASIIVNLVAMFVFPGNRRLSERETMLMALFDILQLALLLALTGGLHNPFALLLLGPVTVSASVLALGSTLFLAAVAMTVVSALAVWHVPLRLPDGAALEMPPLYLFGVWAALIIALAFLSIYSRRVAQEMHAMSDALTATQMALAREQKLTDLGGVVAAAAHELGTPLATIKLAAGELAEELSRNPELSEDARLIAAQADRCRDILRSMGRAGKEDLHLRQAPLTEVLREAVEPHQNRGKTIVFEQSLGAGAEPLPPAIHRRPEIIHGLRNLVQNAVDFAHDTVWVEARWSADWISVRIMDDGDGFPPQVLARIGEPFMRRRRSVRDLVARPQYEGMGLGLFIAKTLLERTGAQLSFANGADQAAPRERRPERSGAVVEVSWPRRKIDARSGEDPVPSAGPNRPIEA